MAPAEAWAAEVIPAGLCRSTIDRNQSADGTVEVISEAHGSPFTPRRMASKTGGTSCAR